jgi:hypothetical protein
VRGADDLTTFMCLNVMEIWEPKPPETLSATPGLLRDPFTLPLHLFLHYFASFGVFHFLTFFKSKDQGLKPVVYVTTNLHQIHARLCNHLFVSNILPHTSDLIRTCCTIFLFVNYRSDMFRSQLSAIF